MLTGKKPRKSEGFALAEKIGADLQRAEVYVTSLSADFKQVR